MRHVPRASGLGLIVLGLIGVMALSVQGCATEVEPELPVTWKTEVGPLLSASCSSCHSGASAPGDYRTTSYAAVLGVGSDTVANAIAGDAESLLLTVLEGDHLGYLGEGSVAEERKAILEQWVVEEDLAYFYSAAHSPAIQNPASGDFHGAMVVASGWSLEGCKTCHGGDYRGSAAGPSCTTCHQNTPESCDTCHGSEQNAAPPRTIYPDSSAGAHQRHLLAPSGRLAAVACGDCHLVPASLAAVGHVDNADDGAAELVFSGAALSGGATPTFDPSTGTCQGTYCHAGASGGAAASPTWTATGLYDGCDGCHGFPPALVADGSNHPQSSQCSSCHGDTVDAAGTIIDVARHGNGTVDVQGGIDQCDSCHTGPAAPVPFRNTQGQTDTTLQTVGAHNAHAGVSPFHAESGDTLGFSCDNCHVVPTGLGHIDGTSAQITFGAVATAKGATPTYDPTTGTCSDVYCHGALLDGGGTNPSPAWSAQGVQTVCGSCHGFPPAQVTSGGTPSAHPASTACDICHATVIDASYSFVDRSLHINGTVDN